jgi:predicted nucleotidyltransferase
MNKELKMAPTEMVTLADLGSAGVLPDTYLCVWVSGSLVRGWGNARSDLDVYVIAEERTTAAAPTTEVVALDPPGVPVKALYIGDRRLDIEYWLDDQVDQLLGKLTWAALEDAGGAGEDLTRTEWVFLDRISYGVSVHESGIDWLHRRRKQLRASACQSVRTAHCLTLADHFVEDALGQLDADDLRSATLSATMAFRSTIEGLLASHGRICAAEKWRARQMSEVEPPEITLERYWELETMRGYDEADPREWVRSTLEVCAELHELISVA